MVRTLLAITLLAIHVSPSFADGGPQSPKQAAAKKESRAAAKPSANSDTPLRRAYNKQRDLYAKYRDTEREALKGTDLEKFRTSHNAAVASLNKKIESLTVKERQAEKAARETLDVAINKKVETSSEVAAMEAKIRSLETERRDLNFEIALISVRLRHSDSPLQRELDEDSGLKTLKAAANKGTREERSAAFKKYWDAREAKLKTLKDARPLLAKVEQLKEQIAQRDKARYETWSEISKTKQKIRYADDESLQPLRDKVTMAQNATRKAGFHADTKALREAVNKASAAYRKRHSELTSGNKALSALRKQMDEANKEIRELQAKSRPATSRTKPQAKDRKSN